MKIKEYTVVSCANCEEVWIVEGNPERSKCPRCEKTRKFKLLKKYKSYDNIRKARLVRAKVKAAIAGDEEDFDKALEEDMVLAENEDIFSGSRFASSSAQSFESVVREAVEKFDSIEEISEYSEEHGYDSDRVEKYISKKKLNGEIIENKDSIKFV